MDNLEILKGLAAQVRNATDIGENTAERVGRVLEGILELGFKNQMFLSRLNDDDANGLITFVRGLVSKEVATMYKGIQFGKDFASGTTGFGGLIDGSGRGELRALRLWEWLEVPELRFNRAEVIVGDEWQAPGGGIVEEVDEVNQIVKLKLEDGDIGKIAYDDLAMGYWHDELTRNNDTEDFDDGMNNRRYAGFYTSYFRITEILDDKANNRFRYELRGVSKDYPVQHHPAVGMHFVCFGNPSNSERQTSKYSTRTYTRYVRRVTTWTFGKENIAMQLGDCSNLKVFGYELDGYSAFLKNVYFSGKIEQFEDIADWMDIQQSLGGFMAPGEIEEIECTIYDAYGRKVTEKYIQFDITRESGDSGSDEVWNNEHTNVGQVFTINFKDLGMRDENHISTMFTVIAIGSDGDSITNSLTYE